QINSLNGPLLGSVLRKRGLANGDQAQTVKIEDWGLDVSLFGNQAGSTGVSATSLAVKAPSVIPVRLPAELVEGCEFVATARLQPGPGAEGTVQMRVLSSKPAGLRLIPGAVHEHGAKS